MYQCISVAKLRPGAMEEVIAAARVVAGEAMKEPGCIYYNALRSDRDLNTLVLIEKWESKACFEAHVAGKPCADFGKVIDPNLDGEAIIHPCEFLF